MNILIENSGYHLRNLGDVAMLQAACVMIRESCPQARMRVFTTEPDRLRELCPEAEPLAPDGQAAWLAAKCFALPFRALPKRVSDGLYAKEKSFKFRHPERAWGSMSVRKGFNRDRREAVERWLACVKDADLVMATGGGYFTDAFALHLEGILHTLRWARCFGRLTVLCGQGLGPMRDRRLRALSASILKSAKHVSLRADNGLEFGRSLGCDVDRWRVTGDDAFALLTHRAPEIPSVDDKSIAAMPSRAQSDTFGLNLRLADYASVDEAILAGVRDALHYLASELKCEYMPLPVDLCPTQGDDIQVRKVLSGEHMHPDYRRPDTPVDLLGLVSRCRAVLTGSYHAAVFALSQGIPVVALTANDYYGSKFAGLVRFFGEAVRVVVLNAGDPFSHITTAMREQWHAPVGKRAEWADRAACIGKGVRDFYADVLIGHQSGHNSECLASGPVKGS